MRVRVFVLACLFPLPILMYHHSMKLWNKGGSTQVPGRQKVCQMIPLKEDIEVTQKEVVEKITSFNEGGVSNRLQHVKRDIESDFKSETENQFDSAGQACKHKADELSVEQKCDIIWLHHSGLPTKSIFGLNNDNIGNNVDLQRTEAPVPTETKQEDSCQ